MAIGDQVRLVAADGGEHARVVVGHEVPVIEVLIHHCEVHGVVVSRPGGAGDREQEAVGQSVGAGVVVEGAADAGKEEDHVCGLGGGGGILPVDVEAVEAEVCE